jgi:hypothetical protein
LFDFSGGYFRVSRQVIRTSILYPDLAKPAGKWAIGFIKFTRDQGNNHRFVMVVSRNHAPLLFVIADKNPARAPHPAPVVFH